MDNVNAYGVFQKKGGLIFRKSAYIQWGNDKKSIGSFLLLNPGNAKPLDLLTLKEGEISQHNIVLDPTMHQMVKLIEKLYQNKELNGRIHIYNLFSLRNPKNEDAIESFEKLVDTKAIEPAEVIPTIKEIKSHPWMCCGWGINNRKKYKHLLHIKSSWQKALVEADIPTFGKLHENGIDFYHLRPRLVADQENLIDELLDIYNSEVKSII